MTNQDNQTIELMTEDEAAEFLRVPGHTIYYYTFKTKQLPGYKIGRTVLYEKSDLISFFKSRRVNKIC